MPNVHDLRFCEHRKWNDDDDPRCAELPFAGESNFLPRHCQPCNTEDCPKHKFAYRSVIADANAIVRGKGF